MKIDALLKSAEPSEIEDKARQLEEDPGYDGYGLLKQNDPFLYYPSLLMQRKHYL